MQEIGFALYDCIQKVWLKYEHISITDSDVGPLQIIIHFWETAHLPHP